MNKVQGCSSLHTNYCSSGQIFDVELLNKSKGKCKEKYLLSIIHVAQIILFEHASIFAPIHINSSSNLDA